MMLCQVVSVASAPGKDIKEASLTSEPKLLACLQEEQTIKGTLKKPGTVVHVYNPRTRKAEVAELQIQG